jgi:hypothetical protein
MCKYCACNQVQFGLTVELMLCINEEYIICNAEYIFHPIICLKFFQYHDVAAPPPPDARHSNSKTFANLANQIHQDPHLIEPVLANTPSHPAASDPSIRSKSPGAGGDVPMPKEISS